MRDMPRLYTISGKRGFPVSELKLFASARSAGKDMKTPFGEYTAMHTANAHCVYTHCKDTNTPFGPCGSSQHNMHRARPMYTRGRSAPHPGVPMRVPCS